MRWQSDAYFFKWRLFTETFKPQTDFEKANLIKMALKLFMKANKRGSPAYSSDTERSLLDELEAFLRTVVVPGKLYINADIRNLNLLSLQKSDAKKVNTSVDAKHEEARNVPVDKMA